MRNPLPAISDSSPLILFARIGHLDLLRQVFRQILIPPAVWREVVVAGAGRPGTDIVQQAPWILRPQLRAHGPWAPLLRGLGPGEVEEIAVALGMASPVLAIFDDGRARRVAERAGLFDVGSAGVLLLAKDAVLIPSMRPLLSDLRAAGLYLSDAATARVLARAGEG